MKVLISCLSWSWGGMEMFTVQSAEELLKNNVDVYIFCLKNSKIDINSSFVEENKKLRIKSNSYLNIFNIHKLRKFIIKHNIDIIHTQFSKDLWTISPALWFVKKRIPLILTKQLGSFVVKKDFLHKLIYKRVSKAIAISTVIKDNLIQTTPLDKEKITIIPNAIDLKRFDISKYKRDEIRKRERIKENEFVFINVARLSPGKGQDIILKAIQQIKIELVNTKIIFIGEAEESEKFYEKELKDFVQSNGLGDLVLFLGFRKDIPELLAMSDVFLFPSEAEAFGISLVEAMAIGLPSIVCKSDGVLDIIIENTTSLTFPRNDIDKLSENILKIRYDENLRKYLSQNSSERAKEFSFEKYNERILKVYEDCIKS